MSDSLAARIYPNLPTAAADDAAPAPRSEGLTSTRDIANKTSPAAPREGGEERSLAERMYPDLPSEEGAPEAPEREEARPAAREPAADGELGAAPTHLVEEFRGLAREAGLNADRTEALRKLHERAIAETSRTYWSQQGEAWAKESRSRFGGQLDSMVRTIQPLLADRTLTPPAVRDLLVQFRLGDHPAIIDMLHRWSARMQPGPGAAGRIYGETPVEKRLRVIRSGIARR